MLQRAARNAYSWWWASHVRTKQSKWLDDNLQDMEEKVDYILKIIDEDGDTFAQRAEMYYRKRPEIVNFVEDSFRGYRALAERYDHLSRELQNANRTIATVFPESVQLRMDDTDDFDTANLPGMVLPSDEFSTMSTKNPPAAPRLEIPKIERKKSKLPSRLMSKKGLLKIDAKEAAVVAPCSGLKVSGAVQRIDELQKGILALQTEKEFVRSSYENGIERYREIHRQITEMQEEVSNLQDEFGIGTVIEDDEARSIMTATALKSCQETLTRLQQKQEQSAEDAQEELQKIRKAQERMKTLKQKHTPDHVEEQEQLERRILSDQDVESSNLELEGSFDHDVHDVESLRIEVKEELGLSLGTTLTTSELAEKVDELVDTIIKLEGDVSSHGAYVQRLRLETKDLHTHLQSLEVEKETSIEGANNMSQRITELEGELQRIQILNKRMNEHNYCLQTSFAEASCNIGDLSQKLQSVKPDDEADIVASFAQSTHAPDVNTSKKVQLQETVHVNNVQEVKERCQMPDKELNNLKKVTSVIHVPNQLQGPKMIASDFNQQPGVPDMQIMPNPGLSSEDKIMTKKARKDGNVGYGNSTLPKPTISDTCNPRKSQLKFSTGDLMMKSEEWFEIDKDQTGPVNDSVISHDFVHRLEVKEHAAQTTSFNEKDNTNIFMSGMQNSIDSFRAATQNVNPQEGFIERENEVALDNDILIQNDAKKQEIRSIESLQQDNDNLGSNDSSGKCRQGNNFSNQGNHNTQQMEDSEQSDISRGSEKRFKEQAAPWLDLATEANKEDSFISNIEVLYVNGGPIASSDDVRDKKGKESGQNTVTMAEDYDSSFERKNAGDQLERTVVGENTGMEEEKNGIHILPSPLIPNGSIRQNNPNAELNHIPVSSPVKISLVSVSTQTNEGMTVPDDFPAVLNGKENEPTAQNGLQTTRTNFTEDLDETIIEEDGSPNWKKLFLSGLDDRERILLQEYTSILRNYKEAKKKLSEVEKRKRASLFRYCIQIKVLESANALKDAEIQSLQKKLSMLYDNVNRTAQSTEREANFEAPDDQSFKSPQKAHADFPHQETNESECIMDERTGLHQTKISCAEEDVCVIVTSTDETLNSSIVEEKIRTDIDELLEENIEFWMKFSSSVHQIQKFTTAVQDLQAEIAKVKEKKHQNGNVDHQSLMSDIRPMYRHLSEIQTELTLWLDKDAVLKDDLQNRLSSLSCIQEEITRMSSADSTVEFSGLSDYQAAMFQGEVLNMKQENDRVVSELQSGLERVRNLRVEIERTLREVDKEFGISVQQQQSRYTAVRSRIPLRSFLFGVKLKKQKPSFFACMNPALQRKYSDLSTLPA